MADLQGAKVQGSNVVLAQQPTTLIRADQKQRSRTAAVLMATLSMEEPAPGTKKKPNNKKMSSVEESGGLVSPRPLLATTTHWWDDFFNVQNLVNGQDLYALYPDEHWGYYKNTSSFSIIFGLFCGTC